MAPPQSTTPTSRSSSVHMDTGNGDTNGNMTVNGSSPHHGMNGTMNGRKTPSHNSNAPGSGNAMPGYPLHQAPPQLIQQSLHNSSGYPGQDISSGAVGENGMSSSPMWNNSNTSANGINNHQPNNNAGSANANGNTNASANRSVWNGGGQDRPPSSMGHSPKVDSSPQHQHQHYQQEQSSSNNTSPVNSRLKTMILNKQQQQQYSQMQQFAQPMFGQQQQMLTPPADGSGRQMMSPHRPEQYGQQQHDSRPPSRQSPNPSQNSAGHFLVEGHHLQRSVIPEGGGIWEWGGDIQNNAHVNPVSAMENFVKFAELGDTEGEGSNSMKSFQGSQLGFQPMKNTICKSELKSDEDWSDKKLFNDELRTSEYSRMQNEDNFFLKKSMNLGHCGGDENESISMNSIKIKEEPYLFRGDGGPMLLEKTSGSWCCRQGGTDKPSPEHLRDGCCPGQGLQTLDEAVESESEKPKEKNGRWSPEAAVSGTTKDYQEHLDRLRNNVRAEVPDCDCFAADKLPPEPGSYYTHLGSARTLADLRTQMEERSGFKDKALRIEKVLYTGKEGKTTQGCPLAKWVIRRANLEEKLLLIVKHRKGHKCSSSWIVVVIVAWEGVPLHEADHVYTLLSTKLNRFGLPTTRRCATNEPRTCACQGLDPNTCGASFSFGCSWSMYYNGCKYARSKTVRKFRLSVRSEEQEVEERMHTLATLVSPLYQSLAPEAFRNQTQFERDASECRLGFKTGRPFSGVTACIDFCAHSHRDLHNMNNGCTVVVSLTKHRSLSKSDDEQLHVLPLYIMDDSDEHGSKEDQAAKEKTGAIETLTKFPCEVRVRSVPLQPCRRHGKKRGKEEDQHCDNVTVKKEPGSHANQGVACKSNVNASSSQQSSGYAQSMTATSVASSGMSLEMAMEAMEAQLQSSQVSSTVLDSPVSMYQGWGYDAWAGRAPGPHPHHAWMAADSQRWSDYSAAISRGPSLERADADSTTAGHCTPGAAGAGLARSVDSPWGGTGGAPLRRESSSNWEAAAAAATGGGSGGKNPADAVIKGNSASTCSKRIEPEEVIPSANTATATADLSLTHPSSHGRLAASVASTLNRLDAQSPAFELPSSAFSPSPVLDTGSATATADQHHGDGEKGGRQQKKSTSSSCWSDSGGGSDAPASANSNSSPWDVPAPAAAAASPSPFRVPKARHTSSHPSEGLWDSGSGSGSAFTSTASGQGQGQDGHKMSAVTGLGHGLGRDAEDCALSGGASKSLAFAPHGLKQESLFDDVKHLSDYQAYGAAAAAASNPAVSVVSAANPFAVPMPGAGSPYGYGGVGYPSMFPESKAYGGGWSDPYVDPHYAQFQAPSMNLNSLYGGAANPYHSAAAAGFMASSMGPAYGYMPAARWDLYGPPPYFPVVPETPKAEPIGEVTDFTDNEECFKDPQMGGVAIALGHGSVLFECAKHEMHSTTALHRPNRLHPTRISLVFYQHRNLNRPKHGWDEWEEKMRLRKLGVTTSPSGSTSTNTASGASMSPCPRPGTPAPNSAAGPGDGGGSGGSHGSHPSRPLPLPHGSKGGSSSQFVVRTPTYTTTTWTTLFPMHPCMVTGPYQESGTGTVG